MEYGIIVGTGTEIVRDGIKRQDIEIAIFEDLKENMNIVNSENETI